MTALRSADLRSAVGLGTFCPQRGSDIQTFDLDATDAAMLRLVVFSRQGYRIYLNGQLVMENQGRARNWQPQFIYEDGRTRIREHLREGTNVLAAMNFLQFFNGKEGDIEVYLEGLDQLPEL